MKIFLDENLSPYLAKGMAELQAGFRQENFEVLHVTDRFGAGAKDDVWIPKIAQMHGVIVTQDLSIRRTKDLWELCSEYKLGIFFVRPPKGKNYRYWEQVEMLTKHWPHIKSLCSTERPFAFIIKPRSSEPELLPS